MASSAALDVDKLKKVRIAFMSFDVDDHTDKAEVAWRKQVRSTAFRTVKGFMSDSVNLCHGSVNRAFIDDALMRLQSGMLVAYLPIEGRHNEVKMQYVGFLLYRNDKDVVTQRHGYYIELVCAMPGVGTLLMHAIVRMTLEAHRSYVRLAALPHVILYYRTKFGFRHVHSYIEHEDPSLEAMMPAVGHLKFNSSKEADANATFDPYLQRLVALNLGHVEHCADKLACSADGYNMVLDVAPWQERVATLPYLEERERYSRSQSRRRFG
jgi:hypothetical protein